ncbi:hypothetical protein GCM10022252_13360 [Streptosporangium oxazolinicum]|uniref:Uncharacterized protein n=1 Tax=Streptosporangium oxazolinicum TaxID=909287 RepID=A0ABP8AIA1_9ACTN
MRAVRVPERVSPGSQASPGEAFGAVRSFPDPVRFLLGLPTGIAVTHRSGLLARGRQKGGPNMIEDEM